MSHASAARRTTGSVCPNCGSDETAFYSRDKGWHDHAVSHAAGCAVPDAATIDYYAWDKLDAAGNRPKVRRPFGPNRNGSPHCRSGSIASGGRYEYCTCDTCF